MKKTSNVPQLASHGPEIIAAVRQAGGIIAKAGPRYDELWLELIALISKTEMDVEAKAEIMGLLDLLEMIRRVHLHADKLITDASCLTIAEAPEILLGVKRKKGGKNAGAAKREQASEWHSQCINEANRLLEHGKARHEISAVLATRFGKSARQVRDVLKKAEVM